MALLLKQKKPNQDISLMGLEKLDLSVFPGCMTTMEIPIVNNRYNIGLDDKKERSKYEKFFGVEFDSPEGQEFLSNYEIKISHDVSAYDPRNPKDAFDLHILKVNGGMGVVALSEQALEESPIDTFKFVITDEYAEVEERVRGKEVKTQAIVELGKLNDNKSNRIILIAKYIFGITGQTLTNKQIAFDKLYDYIDNNIKNASNFLTVCRIDVTHLNAVVKVKEAINRNIIRFNNGQFVLYATQTPLGRTESDVIDFCTNPVNIDIMGAGLKDDSPTSITFQLKQYEE